MEAFLGAVLALLAAVLVIMYWLGRQAGHDAERARDSDDLADDITEVRRIEREVDALPPDELDERLREWTRPEGVPPVRADQDHRPRASDVVFRDQDDDRQA